MVQSQGVESIVPSCPFYFPKTFVTFLGKKGMEGTIPSGLFWSFLSQKITSCFFRKERNIVNYSIWLILVFSFTKFTCFLFEKERNEGTHSMQFLLVPSFLKFICCLFGKERNESNCSI